MLPGIAPVIAAGKGLPIIQYVHAELMATGGTTQTYSGVPLGDAASDRLVVIWVHMAIGGAADLTSATIAGISATKVLEVDGTNSCSAIIQAVVPSGTTGNVVVNWSASVARGGIGVWALYNLQSTTPHDFDAPAGGGVATRSVSLDFAAGGIGIAGIGNNESPSTWTNATERFDLQGASNGISGADYTAATAEIGRSISATNGRTIGGATWR